MLDAACPSTATLKAYCCRRRALGPMIGLGLTGPKIGPRGTPLYGKRWAEACGARASNRARPRAAAPSRVTENLMSSLQPAGQGTHPGRLSQRTAARETYRPAYLPSYPVGPARTRKSERRSTIFPPPAGGTPEPA